MKSVVVKMGMTNITFDNKGVCRRCREQIVHAAQSGLWFHVDFVKGQKAYKDYKHQAQP